MGLVFTFAGIVWEYIKAFPGALEKVSLEGIWSVVLEGWAEGLDDPWFAIFLIVCLFLFWLALFLLRQLVKVVRKSVLA